MVYFWHVPKASGSTVKNVLNYCFELRRAEKTQDVAVSIFRDVCGAGAVKISNLTLALVSLTRPRSSRHSDDPKSMEYPRSPRVLNMDTATPDGLKHSLEQDLASSGLVDVIISNYFLAGAALFTADHQAQTFTVLRHPIE